MMDAEFQSQAHTRALEMLQDFTFKFTGGLSAYKVTDRRRIVGERIRLNPDW